ncbi:Hypothetical predicted protein, partial [Paramuricea clavata]
GSKYIAVREKRTIADAQKYCLHKYQSGTLDSFTDLSDKQELTELLQAERRVQVYYYWTGLKRKRESGSCPCSNEQCTKVAKGKEGPNSIFLSNECFVAMNSASIKCWPCSESLYFICKVNKGNEIY